jgi:signal transduction histidine kinase/ligand-binding sensor domain-containing protein
MRCRLHLSAFAVLLLLIKVCPVLCQDIRFNKVSLPEETIRGIITGITQDLNGNIWFSPNGTGLSRFDGVNLKTYSHDALNPSSLANNYVECVYADRSGNIWAGTFGSGLEKLDTKTGAFTHFKHNEKDPSSISHDTVTCILQDREGFLWIGTEHGGLNRMDPQTGKFTHYRHSENDPNSLSFDMVRTIYEDKAGALWIGTGSPFFDKNANPGKKGGLNRFNKNTGTFTRYLHDEKDQRSLIDDRVRAIFEDSHGNFWVGTAGDGLHTMNRTNGTFERHTYDPGNPGKLSRPPLKKLFSWADDHITFITEDSRKAIWLGTFGNGLMRYDPASKKIDHYTGQKDSAGKFSDSTAWWVFKSRDGVMWMSTWNNSLYRFDPTHQNILHTELYTKRPVYSFLEEPGNILYFGTDSGLLRVDTKNSKTQLFLHDAKKPGSNSENSVFTLYKDRKNRIWTGSIGSPAGGLNLFNPDKQNFTSYKHDPKNISSLVHDAVISIYEDQQSNLWVGTVNGLDRMNMEKGEFTHYKIFPEDTISNGGGKNFVICLLEDSKHNLWVGNVSEGGLHILDRKTGQFKNYLNRHSVICIREDGYGKIWAGAEDGLYTYNSVADSFSLFTDPATGNSFHTFGMVEDNAKNLWITTVTGIYRISSNRNEVSKFSKEFGVTQASLNGISPYKASDGQLFFGSTTGYYSLYPDKISSNAKPPEIVLTYFRIADQEVKPGTSSPLKEDLLQAKQIKLSHDQNVFSFLFNVVHYSNPDANKAMYMLENYDKDWRPAGSERTAYYYNIPPGHYIFRIKAASSEGVWAEKSIDVIITPPWWRSWWAYCMYGLLILAVAYSLHRIQRQRVISAERERTRVRELAQAKEIEKAYTELKATQAQLIQSEKMASLGELTAGIAHEIQNPLNFVNNFSEVNGELIKELKNEVMKGNMDEVSALANDIESNSEKINHHGKRADAIVKGMLQHSRTTNSTKEPTDINKLADEYLRLAYHGLRAKDKTFNATLKTDYDESIGNINIIPQDIGRVILNLINNAFYAVAEKKKQAADSYEPTVLVTTQKKGNKIELSIKDNGNGIPQKVLDKIFQPFFTTKPTGQGTGLGLSLAYDIVKAHGGELKVETKEGEGSSFIIHLSIDSL